MSKPLGALHRQQIAQAFDACVNMTADELERWLDTDESRSVGTTRRGESESVGRRAGRRIVALLGRHPVELEDDDYAHMRRVVGFIRRHAARRLGPGHPRWRYALMNWGHDPLKARAAG